MLHFAEVKSRAAPRYSRVAGVETLVAPAPPPPPAPLRAVVIRLAGASSPTSPIPLDRPASHVLPRDARSDDDADDAARLVAEVRRVPNAPRGSRERYELLVRTDLALHNATLAPLEFRFEPRRDVVSAPAAVVVAPGATFWLPAALAGASAARARWRPRGPESSRRFQVRDGIRRATSFSSLSPLRRGAGLSGSSSENLRASEEDHEPEDDRVDDFSWSEPIPLRVFGADDESSSSPPPPPAFSSAMTRDARTTPFRCLVGARENVEGASRVVAVAPPLVVTNALPFAVTVSVSFAGRPDVERAAPGRVVPPGGVAAMHDDALHPTFPVTLHARPHGYTHCESIVVPALARARDRARLDDGRRRRRKSERTVLRRLPRRVRGACGRISRITRRREEKRDVRVRLGGERSRARDDGRTRNASGGRVRADAREERDGGFVGASRGDGGGGGRRRHRRVSSGGSIGRRRSRGGDETSRRTPRTRPRRRRGGRLLVAGAPRRAERRRAARGTIAETETREEHRHTQPRHVPGPDASSPSGIVRRETHADAVAIGESRRRRRRRVGDARRRRVERLRERFRGDVHRVRKWRESRRRRRRDKRRRRSERERRRERRRGDDVRSSDVVVSPRRFPRARVDSTSSA